MYGLHRSILIRAGSVGVSVKIFIKADLLAATLWILILTLDYLFPRIAFPNERS